ncbi:ATP-binding cassette domain-containing protein [Haliangium sp.]|uniref:ATP-binding cassette domain-containing protein n=1 Tax=Haliangium sp. TaxID=2663208 RepID=UPI003D0E8003
MSFVRLSEVAFSYRDPIDVLTAVSFDLHPGWTGVVGENGGGKSTLLGLVAGALAPTAGRIEREPADPVVHLCPQRVEHASPAIVAFAAGWSRAEIRLRARLGLDPDQLERWPSLSPGERKRWQIGAALAAQPDLLLLDEPTNHLDAEARALVRDALARYRGVGVLVSHDRDLLDALTDRTVRVHAGTARLYRGSYADARGTWEGERAAARQAHADARREQRALRRRLADSRRHRAGAEGRISARTRIKGPKDSDARSIAAKTRVMAGEARHGRQVGVLRRAVERAGARAEAIEVGKDRGGALFVDYQPAPKPTLAALGGDGLDLVAGERVLVRDLRVGLGRRDRVHLAGPNGAGKTTLVRALLAAAWARERILYLPQHIAPDQRDALLAEVRALPPDARGRVMQVAAALGLEPARVLATDAPSPGELRKLVIARGLGLGAWAVILDEPTNHLDLPSIERLERALADYPGAVLVVSHDLRFARAVTDIVWHLGDGRLDIEPGADRDRQRPSGVA